MVRDDDDDLEMFGQAEDVYKSDGGKAEQRERKARSKGLLNKLKLAQLRTSVGKDQISTTDAANLDRDDDRKEEKPVETFGTKTHMQEERADVTTVAEKPQNEKLIAEQQAHEDAKRQSGEEYQQEPG